MIDIAMYDESQVLTVLRVERLPYSNCLPYHRSCFLCCRPILLSLTHCRDLWRRELSHTTEPVSKTVYPVRCLLPRPAIARWRLGQFCHTLWQKPTIRQSHYAGRSRCPGRHPLLLHVACVRLRIPDLSPNQPTRHIAGSRSYTCEIARLGSIPWLHMRARLLDSLHLYEECLSCC